MKEESLVERSEKLGKVLDAALQGLKGRHASVGDIRCKGLWGCVELVSDPVSKKPLVGFNASGPEAKPASDISKSLLSQGIFSRVRWNYIYFGPPLTTTEEDLMGFTKALDKALEIADGYMD